LFAGPSPLVQFDLDVADAAGITGRAVMVMPGHRPGAAVR